MSWREQALLKWATVLAKLHTLPQLLSFESIRRGMHNEDDLAFADAKAYHELLHGERGEKARSSVAEQSEREMPGDIILGNQETHHHEAPKNPAMLPKVKSQLLPIALTAGLTLAGVVGVATPFVLNLLNKQSTETTTPNVVKPIKDVDSKVRIRLGR